MALNQYDLPLGGDKLAVTFTQTVTAVTGGATSLGGTSAIRLLIDDAVTISKTDALKLIEILEYFVVERTWPPS
ncbi:hypothetical protein UFOVP6_19 [uncultured Caudovirales phage]|uniref:Uncharacterized protein n=1 Tax=uncultured Caudovirales phage TaxID=2100421 RepID=A0A6J5KIX5_9CAUD|nr:hypothetical protein UFOVP6_19 [uncultured Caudovirales phage]